MKEILRNKVIRDVPKPNQSLFWSIKFQPMLRAHLLWHRDHALPTRLWVVF